MRRAKMIVTHVVAFLIGGLLCCGTPEHDPKAAPAICPTLAEGHDPDAEALAAIDNARSSITLTCPRLYSVPVAEALIRAMERGVDVSVKMEAAREAIDPLEMADVLEGAGAEVSLVPIRLEDRRIIVIDSRWTLIDGHGPIER